MDLEEHVILTGLDHKEQSNRKLQPAKLTAMYTAGNRTWLFDRYELYLLSIEGWNPIWARFLNLLTNYIHVSKFIKRGNNRLPFYTDHRNFLRKESINFT